MPNIELPISPEYVADWKVRDAIRELHQNMADQQTVNPANEMLLDYDPQLQIMRLGNRQSTLDTSTLILGKTTKANDDRTIGKFGEGYKLALIVLLRMGKSVIIYNSPYVWTPTIKHSEVFNSAILNINTVKYRFKQCPEHDLIFSISGITPEEYADIQEHNLYYHEETETLTHNFGRIMLDPKYKGMLFVNGLFVTKLPDAEYGYDIKPAYLNIGRDRDLVNHWDVYYKTAQMWATQTTKAELVNELITNNSKDVYYIDNCIWQLPEHTVKYIGGSWYDTHGLKAVPVANDQQAQQAKIQFGDDVQTVIVSDQMLAVLKRCPQFKETQAPDSILKQSPAEIIQAMLDSPDKDRYKKAVREELENLLTLAKHWTWKR